jgi:hypothetical protein
VTIWDLFVVAVQRWVVVLVCGALTGLLVFQVAHAKPVYLSQVRVVLLAPPSARLNALGATPQSLIDLAGVVGRKVNGADAGPQVVSGGVTIAGEGIRSGYSVNQPNQGGQWANNFEDPVLDVQAVDATAEGSRAQMAVALGKVEAALTAIQDEQGVAQADRVRTTLSPSTPQVVVKKGSNVRAVGASVAIGVLVAGAVLAFLGPRTHRRRKPPPADPAPPGDPAAPAASADPAADSTPAALASR